MKNKKVKLVFNASDVRRVVEHSCAAKSQDRIAYTKEKVSCASIILVHDQGLYLMSNGKPVDYLKADEAEPMRMAFCAYARGCDPNQDEEFWENSRELVGGDDFVETIECAQGLLDLLNVKPKAKIVTFILEDEEKVTIRVGK